MSDKKKFSKVPSQKQKFQFMGLEPKMKLRIELRVKKRFSKGGSVHDYYKDLL
jgi:hypothetical protein